jgi:hypothetical protein
MCEIFYWSPKRPVLNYNQDDGHVQKRNRPTYTQLLDLSVTFVLEVGSISLCHVSVIQRKLHNEELHNLYFPRRGSDQDSRGGQDILAVFTWLRHSPTVDSCKYGNEPSGLSASLNFQVNQRGPRIAESIQTKVRYISLRHMRA